MKKQFTDKGDKYYSALDKGLSISAKRKDDDELDDIDMQIEEDRKAFCYSGMHSIVLYWSYSYYTPLQGFSTCID